MLCMQFMKRIKRSCRSMKEIKTLWFADNIDILSEYIEELEDTMNSVDLILKENYELGINKDKKK